MAQIGMPSDTAISEVMQMKNHEFYKQKVVRMEKNNESEVNDEKLNRAKIGHYSKLAFFVVVGMAIAFGSVAGYKYIQAKNAETIVNYCKSVTETDDQFYCCGGCAVEKYDVFEYNVMEDKCICEKNGKSFTLWDE